MKKINWFLLTLLISLGLVFVGCGDDASSGDDDDDITGDDDDDITGDDDDDNDVSDDDDDDADCKEDADCEGNKVCIDGVCKPQVYCNDPSGGKYSAGECIDDYDCEKKFFCDRGEVSNTYTKKDGTSVDCGTCTPICTSNADCTAPEICNFVSGKCQVPACSDDAECGSDCCIKGKCEACPAVAPTKCALTGGDTVLVPGGKFMTGAAAWEGDVAVARVEFTWESSDEAVATVAPTSAKSPKAAIEAKGAGTAEITAKIGSVTCEGKITVTVVEPGAEVIVYVRDAADGKPISGGKVYISDSECKDNGDGSYTCSGDKNMDLHVTHSGYTYVSILGGLNSNVAVVHLDKNPADSKEAHYKGKFNYADMEGDLSIGIASSSITGNLLDMDFMSLIGESLPTTLTCEGIYEGDVDLPEGITFAFGSICEEAKESYGATPGIGYRVPWGIGGKLTTDDVLDNVNKFADLFGGDTDDLPIGQLMSAIMPWIARFQHALGPITNFKVGDDLTINMTLDAPLGVIRKIKTPKLADWPDADSGYTDGIAFLAGVVDKELGAIPLGLTVGVDNPDNKPGKADGKITPPEDMAGLVEGEVALNMAPKHSGIEGHTYMLAGLTMSFSGLDAGLNISGLVEFRDNFSSDIDWSGKEFLGFAFDSGYNMGSREITLSQVSGGANFYRAHFDGDNEKYWIIYTKAPGKFTAPDLPGLDDVRGLDLEKKNFKAEAIKVKDGLTPADLVDPSKSYRLDALLELVEGFSVYEKKE